MFMNVLEVMEYRKRFILREPKNILRCAERKSLPQSSNRKVKRKTNAISCGFWEKITKICVCEQENVVVAFVLHNLSKTTGL
jgi:hypothetical protein